VDDQDKMLDPGLSRRELLKRAGIAGAAAAVPFDLGAQAPQARLVPETLSAQEAETLEAITARLIPTDANGPGALEAQAARYIDRALGGALASFREAYRSGLAAVDGYARASKSMPFAGLTPENQDEILREIERNVATGFAGPPSAFFGLVLAHTIQGTFCDPYYGGNAGFVGWDLIGYPGVRLAVSANEQRLDARPKPTHMSAYDYTMFSGRRPARASLDRDRGHDAE
jgi:gluconate 2-dehydrogenase gamma chain